MSSGDAAIIEEIDRPSRGGESLDVLLQLTLPIVLILAFLVVTEVQTLTDQIHRLKKDIENTATGRLSEERDTTLMELQLQLLYQATDWVARAEEEAFALHEYRRAAPSIRDILAGRIDPAFVATSRRLYESLNGEERRAVTEDRLQGAIEERFADLVATELTEFDDAARAKVLRIPAAHRTLYETKLDGYLERFENTGAAVQLTLMLKWLENQRVSDSVQEESRSLWRRLQRTLIRSDNRTDIALEEFVNLRAQKLIQELAEHEVPVLDKTRQEAHLG